MRSLSKLSKFCRQNITEMETNWASLVYTHMNYLNMLQVSLKYDAGMTNIGS